MAQKLTHYPLTHAGIRKLIHPRLSTEIDNQTAIKYLRFLHPVKIEALELPRSVYGRWSPAVPTHPAHLLISVPDLANQRWKLVREVNLPYDPRTAGDSLREDMTLDEMEDHFRALLADPPYRIDLDGLETDILRVECDREHPVWPNHGECNGSPYSVPFGILEPLIACGQGEPVYRTGFRYLPGLRLAECSPSAPRGMALRQTPLSLTYGNSDFSIGFSLKRPMLMHLGWDALAASVKGQCANRLKADWAIGAGTQLGGLSGPLVKTYFQDFGAQHWSGEVSVRGNVVEYRNLDAIEGLTISARFTIEPDGFLLELDQTCNALLPVLEAETWRLAWDLRQGMTSANAVPTITPGRSGKVSFPIAFSGDGNGCLVCEPVPNGFTPWTAQVESYRHASTNTCGFTPGEGVGNDDLFCLPYGEKHLTLRFSLDSYAPKRDGSRRKLPEGLRRHWGSIYACFRPEYRGFSNNAASVNCHLSQAVPAEIISTTARLDCGLDPIRLSQFTLKRALLDGGGYGYWRSLYLDSDPALLIAVGKNHQASPDMDWLRSVEPGLREITSRMLDLTGDGDLIVCRELSGNSGSYRWSCNGMDVVGFGHLDAYVNALGYRALRNVAALFHDLDSPTLADRCRRAAAKIKDTYANVFLNPETGWVGGWRSRDGKLHDYGFIWVNGPAIAFGLLEPESARQALLNLEAARMHKPGTEGYWGLPSNLLPLSPLDHMMPIIWATPEPTFENYTDGGLYGFHASYYLRALSIYGLKEQAARLSSELEKGLAAGYFNGGIGQGTEFRSWTGLPTGYEGTLIGSFGPVYGIAIQKGILKPLEPEWWPAGG